MGTVIDLHGARRDNAGLVSTPADVLPPGCRGAACPAFALCRGRCGTPRTESAAPGYPHGQSVGTARR